MSKLLPEGLLEIMQCPNCGGTLVEVEDPPSLRCTRCHLVYAVDEHGVPNMLVEDATKAED